MLIIMIKDSQSLEEALQVFADDRIRSFVKRQIEQLSDNCQGTFSNKDRLMVKIRFQDTAFHFKPPETYIDFLVKLRKGFPLSAPRVYMRTSICNPTTNDARDYLSQILGKEWDYLNTLRDIEKGIPAFVDRIYTLKKSNLDIQKLGRYHLGELFSYKLVKESKGMEMFLSFEETQEAVHMDYLTLSDCHLFLLRPEQQPTIDEGKLHVPGEQKFDSMRLVLFADIQSVSEIRISRQQNSYVQITLRTFKYRKMSVQPVSVRLRYRVVKLKQFLKKLMKCMTKFQWMQIVYETSRKDEFSSIQEQVICSENNLKKYFNKDNINLLNSQYQNAVEHLSGMDNPVYLMYLHKISQLSLREDVKLVTSVADTQIMK